MGYSSVVDHRAMIFDKVRNPLYEKAISDAVTKDSVVLDLGCGLGIHGLMAAKYGAKRVYFVEPEDVIEVAKEISKSNNFNSEQIFIKGKIEDIDLPEKVDLIISVFTGNFLMEEDLLPSLFLARDKYLKKNGKLIPDSAYMECVPVFLPKFYEEEINCWSEINFGIDFSPAKNYVTNHVFYPRHPISPEYLCNPQKFFYLDLHKDNSTEIDHSLEFKTEKNAICHGVMGWFNINIGKNCLSTSPKNPKTHWKHAFLPLQKPLELKKNDTINFKLTRKHFGDWVWKIKTDKFEQISSKLLSRPFSLEMIKKSSLDFKPELNDKGKALLSVLSQIKNQNSNEKILSTIVDVFPELFKDSERSKKYLSNVIKNYCK